MKIRISRSQLFEYLNLFFLTAVIFIPVYFCIIHYAEFNDDFRAHILFAKTMLENINEVPGVWIAHASWQVLVILVHLLIGQTWKTDGLVVTMCTVLLANGLLFWLLRKKLRPFFAGALSTGLLIIAPILLIDPNNDYLWCMMNGFIAPNTYHNPTILLLKPLAILQLYFSVSALNGEKANWKGYILPAICSAVAVFTKPNYAMCLLPVICFIGFIRLLKKQTVDWKRLLFGIIIPSVVVLAIQYLIFFGPNGDSSIIFAPFLVIQHYASNLLLKLLLSILFPVIVCVIYFKEAIKDTRIQLGWLGFILGIFYAYLFAEAGERIFAGNFFWCAEISLFILFVCTVLFLVDQKLDQKTILSKWLIIVSGLLHLACGIFYYFYMFFSYDVRYF